MFINKNKEIGFVFIKPSGQGRVGQGHEQWPGRGGRTGGILLVPRLGDRMAESGHWAG